MILRRLTKHVRDQNWFAVFLDFFIVVVGILIAFQITNWSEDQSNRKLERHYLERLVEDMDKSIKANERSRAYVEYNHNNALIVQKSLTACEVAEGQDDMFADGLYQFGRFLPANYDLGTIYELRSAGNFSIIQNADLRSQLNSLVSESNEYSEILPPIAIRMGPLLNQMDRHAIVTRENIPPHSGSITANDIKFDLQSMCDDRELLAAISMTRSINQFHLDRYGIALRSLAETRRMLRAELSMPEEEVEPQ